MAVKSEGLTVLALDVAAVKTKCEILGEYAAVSSLEQAYGYLITSVRMAMIDEVEAGSESVEEGIEEV